MKRRWGALAIVLWATGVALLVADLGGFLLINITAAPLALLLGWVLGEACASKEEDW